MSLPDGPGSFEGIGANASMAGNMGSMTYAVPLALPEGYSTATPSLGLSYDSGGGNGVAGLGWSFDSPSIERMTLRGYPRYVRDDAIAADRSQELVRTSSSGSSAVYRARREGDFVRRTWVDVGAAGYWKAESPDGSVQYFGAQSDGTLVPDARLAGPTGETFRYYLVESIDLHGHRIRYDYQRIDGMPYLTRIAYAFDASGTVPRYVVDFAYESRPDPITDAKPGFVTRMSRRLVGVSLSVGGETVRRYVLRYEAEQVAGGLSRLVRIDRYGRNGVLDPSSLSFGYSPSLTTACPTGFCVRPRLVSMGTLAGAGALRSGAAALVDLDGDALPDIVDTSMSGAHRIYRNRLAGDGRARFESTPVLSTAGTRSGFDASLPYVQEIDVDGDGFTDLANLASRTALCNRGTGDWSATGCTVGSALDVTLESDPASPSDNDPRRTRFIDIDGDRRIDLLRTDSISSTIVRRNTASGFQSMAVEPIGALFDDERLFLADLNGDGMLDPVLLGIDGTVNRRLHLGGGRWSAWEVVPGPTLSLSEAQAAQLEDLNGDGLDDIVIVLFDSVRYALNRSGERFDPLVTISAADVDGGMGVRAATTSVLFADMNASGSTDIVWVQATGEVLYLEVFPSPPNLLSRIDNGLGYVQEIEYGSAIAARAADAAPWSLPLTVPTSVVTRIDAYTMTTGGPGGVGLHDVTTYRYRDGYYDGREKLLRGFVRVEEVSGGDAATDSQESGRTISTYDVGASDWYRAGLLITRQVLGGAGQDERVLAEERMTYGDCSLADVPGEGLELPVRYLCELERTTVLKEGGSSSEWVTMRTQSTYDGYGQITLAANLGVVSLGAPEAATSCEPCGPEDGGAGGACGPTCLGDEAYTETAYVVPGQATAGRWILGRAHTVRTYGIAGGPTTEVRTHYDGAPFVGLPLGQLTKGDPTRVLALQDASTQAYVATDRASYDAHGNVLVALDANGSAGDESNHRRSYAYDALGLRVVRTEVHLLSPEGEPYRLRREYAYDDGLDLLTEATSWMVVKGASVVSARNATSYRYDGLGRRIAVLEPGDVEGAPTTTYTWELGNPSSRVVGSVRSQLGRAPDVQFVVCADGLGREYQRRTRISGDSYRVTGHAMLNRRGLPIRVFQEYVGSGPDCDPTSPPDVASETFRYDVLGREVERTRADGSVVRTSYRPLATVRYDEEDSNPAGPNAHTPTIERRDGLGRVVAVERTQSDGSTVATRARFDSLGRMIAFVDPAGEIKRSTYDALGRLVAVEDPSYGLTRLERDSVGNVVRRVDARGIATVFAYDGANRLSMQQEEADPEGSTVTLRYDFGGTCDARSCTNAAGRLIETTFPVGTLVTSRLGGERVGRDQRGYDARGRGVYDARLIAGTLFPTRHAFDAMGRRIETVHPDGRRLEYRYDGASRVIAIDGVVDSVEFDGRGLPSRIRHANGTEDAFAYDASLRGIARSTRARSGVALQDLSYVRDRAGNLLEMTDAAPLPAGFERRDATFHYDALYRVTGADYTSESGATETNRFAYGAGDDLLESVSSAGRLGALDLADPEYDAMHPHRLISAGGIDYDYDEAGHLIRRGDVDLAWDAFGRLESARRGDEVLVELAHGAGTSRVATVVGGGITLHVSPDFEIRDGIAVTYVRLAGQRIARLESPAFAAELLGDSAPDGAPDGVVGAADAWMAYAVARGIVSGSGSKAADGAVLLRAAARRLLAEAGDAVVTLHSDHLGNVVAATDASGEVRGYRRYAVPTGEVRSQGFVDAYGAFGQEEFPSLGLVRFEHRWLDLTTRRWTRPDPLFQHIASLTVENARDMANPYAYVGNAFVNLVDPTGLVSRAPLPARKAGRPGAQVMTRTDSVRRIVTRDPNTGWAEQAGRNCTLCTAAFIEGSTSSRMAREANLPEGPLNAAQRQSLARSRSWYANEQGPFATLEDAMGEMRGMADRYEDFMLTFERADANGVRSQHTIAARLHDTGFAFHDPQNGAVDVFRDGEIFAARQAVEGQSFEAGGNAIRGLFSGSGFLIQPGPRL